MTLDRFEHTSDFKSVMVIPHNVKIVVSGKERVSYCKAIERRLEISDGDLELFERLKDSKGKIVSLAIDGLNTDGGHHKQFFLEEILSTLIESNQELDGLEEKYQWEKGIPA